jgi:hypothetical protein
MAIKNDSKILIESLNENKDFLNKENFLELIKNHTLREHLMYVLSDELLNDKDIALEILKFYPFALKKMNSKIKKNREFLIKAIERNEIVFTWIEKELKEDKDIVFALIEKNPWMLVKTSDSIKNDKKILEKWEHILFNKFGIKHEEDIKNGWDNFFFLDIKVFYRDRMRVLLAYKESYYLEKIIGNDILKKKVVKY